MRPLIALLAVAALAVAAVPALAATRTVKVIDNEFSPRSLAVKKGTTVRWQFAGEKRHNVVVERGPRKFSSAIKDSGSYARKLRRKGTYRIVCTLHAGMAMTVKVR